MDGGEFPLPLAFGLFNLPSAPCTIRRECVDHIIVLGEVHLRQILPPRSRTKPTPLTK